LIFISSKYVISVVEYITLEVGISVGFTTSSAQVPYGTSYFHL